MPVRPQLVGPLLIPAGEVEARPLRIIALQPWGQAADGWRAVYSLEELRPELERIRATGADAIRLYEAPNRELLDCCEENGLGVLAGLPWGWHEDGFDCSATWRRAAGDLVAGAVEESRGHPALWGWFVGNEIPASIARWVGWDRLQSLLDSLVDRVHRVDPRSWAAYATYPPTLPLTPARADLVVANLYLERPEQIEAYLPVLQAWAGGRPLLLGEFGLDVCRNGEEAQMRLLLEAWDAAQLHGLAGVTYFSWSDRWWASGKEVDDWRFGLVEREGAPRPVLGALAARWQGLDAEPKLPSASAIICTHGGAARIGPALQCLRAQTLPEFELIIVDDGNDSALRERLEREARLDAEGFGQLREGLSVRLVVQDHAGLGTARNRGAECASGEVLVYLDDDSEPQREWLERLLSGMEHFGWDAAGGPVQAPRRSGASGAERLLARAPGQAQPVLLGDGRAEHLPGCSIAVRRAAWSWVGGWGVGYWRAGDDVDFCWRLENAGLRLGFVADALMEHRPRSTWLGYFRQQIGYGRAERLLETAWPERVDERGRLRWRGAVYLAEGRGERFHIEDADFPQIYTHRHGFGGSGLSLGARMLRRLQELARRWGYWSGR